MLERVVLQPPEIVDVEGPVIFIAGPIQGAPDWQSEAIAQIHDLDPTIVVASPRKDYPEGTFDFDKQVDWETHYLHLAGATGAVAFWLALQAYPTPGRDYAQTSRNELGEWRTRHELQGASLVVGIEKGFGNERFIRRKLAQQCPNVKVVDSLAAMCQHAVDLAR